MAEMIFIAQTGCKSSQEQKILLEEAGNVLQFHDILSYKWTREKLLPFVRGRAPLQIMNGDDALIKEGKVDPLLLTWEDALAMMLESPSLIKGPLISVDSLSIQGMKDSRLQRYLGGPQQPTVKVNDIGCRAVFRAAQSTWRKKRNWNPLFSQSFA